MRNSFVFYESFYDAISDLGKQQQQKIFDAICRYALFDEEPELSGALSTVFKLIKPQIDANTKRYENGKKGGRPEKSTDSEDEKKSEKTKSKPNNNQTKTKAKPNETKPKPNVNVNVNVNDNVNANANDNDNGLGFRDSENQSRGASARCGGQSSSNLEFWKMLTADDIDAVYDVYPESGGILINEVADEVMRKRKLERITDPLAYILGYAKNVSWNDKTDQVQ